MKPVVLNKRLGSGALLALLIQIPAQAQPAPGAPAQASAPLEAPTSSLWSRLWRTADQRGQALLRQGQAAAAAREFVEPEHKAHAALLAADYAAAAQTLSGIDTAEAHYNRGNALAHAGDLQGALKAYDAALQRNPQHTDARHNRDLVAAALQKQKDEKKDSGKQDNQSGDKPTDQKDGKPDGKPGSKPDTKPDDQQGGKPSDKPGAQQDAKAGGKPGDKPDNGQAGKAGNPAASAPPTGPVSAPVAAASAAKDDAAQARRDADSALKGPQPPAAPQPGASGAQQGQGGDDAGKVRVAPAASAAPPVTEKQVAQDQWLRAIPDDPGGLLRRKFLIEHLLRQQGQKP